MRMEPIEVRLLDPLKEMGGGLKVPVPNPMRTAELGVAPRGAIVS